MSNDALRHEFADTFALVQDQMRDLAVLQGKRALLTATATAADGTVEVTVDAQRVVAKVVVDESYLDDFEFAELSGHITTAAQAAAREVDERGATLLAPLTERRHVISDLSRNVVDVPDLADILSSLNSLTSVPDAPLPIAGDGDGSDDDAAYPTVRR